MNAISLFSGMGGDSLGLVQAGLSLVAYSEKEKVFRETHDLNFKHCDLLGKDYNSNISQIPDAEFAKYSGNVDVIFAGFPCQGFSNAGKKDINDVRNTLFREFLRSASIIKPKYIIGENVKGLLNRKDAQGHLYIDVIVKEFEKIGYKVGYKVCKTEKYGIPQKRERLIIIGILGATEEITFPPEQSKQVGLQNIVTFNMKGAIKIEPEDFDMLSIPPACILTDMTNDEGENAVHPYLRLKAKTRDEVYLGKKWSNMLSFSKRDSPIHSEIVDIRKPSKTIICTYSHQPRLLVPLRNKNGYYLRCLLPDELKQIQGFPADYQIAGNDKQQIIQIGNAVPPGLIRQIVGHMMTM